ncbi:MULTISPECIES: DUF6379 domain-containing protein [unclassified Rathayibacter]|uniref:C-glycoside deglycosidase beta subunit domain-containing protein n=1 Tax=unclassified Rathayibacter TaxID=2609250 RepID=UPI001FCA0323|nr:MULTISPECIES: DUF6379 domain-containing protein [unclassified Rathayibacter]
MFLERELIQSVGFANVREGDEVTGFRLHLRMPSYRGLAASLIDGVSVRVDDVVDVGHDTPLWRFDGRDIGIDELRRSDGLRWQLEEPGVVTVPHPGGLAPGVHEVEVELLLRASYIPIEHQPSRYRSTRKVTIVR